jgi:flagellum-specific peptidoglycan hydrolase FlgJ
MLSVFVCVEIRPTCPPLTHPPSQLSVAETSTKEFINGKWVTIDADFAKYDSFEQSITAHAGFFIRNKRYANTKSLNG